MIKEPVARALFPQNAPLKRKRGCPCYAQLADGQFRNFEQPISRKGYREGNATVGGRKRARSKNKLTSGGGGGGGGVSAFPPFFSSVANGRHRIRFHKLRIKQRRTPSGRCQTRRRSLSLSVCIYIWERVEGAKARRWS